MRYGPDDKFWVVVDPKPDSTLDDLVFKASLRDLELQFRGGLSIDENPTLFTDRQEAVGRHCSVWVATRGRMLNILIVPCATSRGSSE
jgi:hypothetical protein